MLLNDFFQDRPLLHALVDGDLRHPVHVLEGVDVAAGEEPVGRQLLPFFHFFLVEALDLLLAVEMRLVKKSRSNT
jgi:hypothetical protein